MAVALHTFRLMRLVNGTSSRGRKSSAREGSTAGARTGMRAARLNVSADLRSNDTAPPSVVLQHVRIVVVVVLIAGSDCRSMSGRKTFLFQSPEGVEKAHTTCHCLGMTSSGRTALGA